MLEFRGKFADPLAELVCDEWLLNQCDRGELPALIRFWETEQLCVVLGYGNHLEKEVFSARCASAGIPVYRRCTGGGTVLLGPGVLCYSLVIPFSEHGALATVSGANDFIMERNRQALEKASGQPVSVRGCTDLVVGDLKFSGNAQRRRRTALLFHGTLLLQFDPSVMESTLRLPERRPKYRGDRGHAAFVGNLALDASDVMQAMRTIWKVQGDALSVPRDAIESMTEERRGDQRWVCFA